MDTLHGAAQLSQSVSKLHRACRIFYQIAKIYMNHRPQTVEPPGYQGDMPQPSASLPLTETPQQLPQLDSDIDLPDFPLSHEDWNGMLDEWDLGLGAENAREMSSYFEQYLSGTGTGALGNPGSFN